MTTPIKSAINHEVQAEVVTKFHGGIPKAPNVPKITKHSYSIQAESEEELITRITSIFDEANIPYKICNIFMTLHILYRCESGKCMLRIYKNEGAYKRDSEAGNFILERDNYSRELHYRWIYWFLEDILFNRMGATPEKLTSYLRDLDKVKLPFL